MIRVLVVDDSTVVQKTFSKILNSQPGIEVVGVAGDPYIAREQIMELNPDVITLDIEMPRMDGLSFLRKLVKHHPLPVVVVSSMTERGSKQAIEALQLGAIEVLCKPGLECTLSELAVALTRSVRIAASSSMKPLNATSVNERTKKSSVASLRLQPTASDAILAIGASTGGTRAIEEILQGLPAECPATVIVQHMPVNFTRAFADRLNSCCEMEVREAKNGDRVERGCVLIAEGGQHLLLRGSRGRYYVEVKSGPPVSRHCPSVDVLFRSVAQVAQQKSIGVLLTGMGSDGARGLLEMKQNGAITLCQDEASSIVYGMPKAAVAIDAATLTLTLKDVSTKIMELVASGFAQHKC